ncbi:MAG: metallophosphoesterase family protein [Candidatus Wallbacteria bacterium]|nr:metallophosphoesterase family protein [Candidatus Wallbacteria bacterium]
MRYVICSDLHANLEAVRAFESSISVLDKLVILGDFVGYNPDPEPVIEIMRRWDEEGRIFAKVTGNHDLAVTDLSVRARFTDHARSVISWTGDKLSAESKTWLAGLPVSGSLSSSVFYCHGSIRDTHEYILDDQTALEVFDELPVGGKVLFFGHTHFPIILELNQKREMTIYETADELEFKFKNDCLYLINPGSIGQPRDGDPRLCYLVYDQENNTVTYHKKEYNFTATQNKIVSSGLPKLLALRLSEGK